MVDGNVAYFMGNNGETCSYNSTTKRWSKLPRCLCAWSSLAVIRGILTAIGGCKNMLHPDPENKLLSIVNDKDKKWVEHFPPMPAKRYNIAAVTTKQHLIVAGGSSGPFIHLNTVEVMDIQTLVWSTAASLPYPYPRARASATMYGDHLYMLGEHDKGWRTQSVLTCSLTKLLQSCSETSDPVWCRITDVPEYNSTCAAVNGELVAVGGVNKGYNSIAAVHKYNPTTNSWYLINNMPTARYDCLVAFLPTNEMIVVGGCTHSWFSPTKKVEIVSIVNL